MNGKNQVAVDITGNVESYRKASAEAVQIQQQTNATMARNDAAWQAEFDRSQEARARQKREKEAQLERNWQDAQRRHREELEKTTGAEEASHKKIEAANERSIRSYSRLAAAAGAAAVAAAAYVAKLSVSGAAQAERSENRFDAMHRLTGGTSGFSRAQLGDMVDGMASRTVHGDEEIRDAMSRLMTFRQIGGQAFSETMSMASGLAEVMGGTLAAAVETLGRALDDPERGLQALTRAGVTFTESQRALIRQMVEMGDIAGAQQIILEQLRTKGFAAIADEIYKEGGYTKAMSGAAKATNELFEAIGKTSAVKAPTVAFFDGVTKSAQTLRDLIENGTWVEKYLLMTGAVLSPGAAAAYLQRRSPSVQGTPATAIANLRAAENATLEQQRRAAQAAQERQERGQALAGRQGSKADSSLAAYNQQVDAEAWRFYNQTEARLGADRERREEEMRRQRGLADEAYARGVTNPAAMWTADNPQGLTQDGTVKRAETALTGLRDTGTETYRELQRAVEGWGQASSRAMAKMALDGRMSFEDLAGAARMFGEELLAIQIQRRVMAPLLDGATGWLDSKLNHPGFGPAETDATAGGTFLAGAWHSGGIAGRNAPGVRRVPRGMFAGAPRFHEGGEVPAILKAGEEVLTERDPRHRRNGGGTSVTVNVINQTSMPVKSEASAPRMEGGRMVVDMLLTELSRDAGATEQLRSRLSPPQH